MNSTTRAAISPLAMAILFGLAFLPTANAFTTDFESPTYASGTIVGQDTWAGTNGGVTRILTAAEIAGELTAAGLNPADPVHGGTQALLVSGASGSSSTFRPVVGFDTAEVAVLDLWARPLTPGAADSTIGMNLNNLFFTMEDSSGARAAAVRFGATVDMGLIQSTSIDAYAEDVTGGWFATGATWDADTWYNLRMVADYSSKTYNVFVDGTQVAGDVPFYNANSANLSQIRVFRGSGQAGAIVDDIFVGAVPEPSTLALLLIAGCGLALRRRK